MLGFFRDNAIDQVYAYEMLQKFAVGLIGIFIPVYIAAEGSPLSWVFIYLFGYTAVFALSSIGISYVIARIGFKHSLVLSYVFYLPAFVLLRVATLSPELIMSVAGLVGIGKALHWIPLHAEFAVDSEHSTREKASSRILGLPRLSKAAAPFIGGVVMAAFGFHALVAVALFFFILSAVPLFASGDHRDPLDWDFLGMLDRRHVKYGSLFFLRGVTITTGVFLFPLYVFFIIGGSINVGGVSSMASVGSTAFALMVGRVSSRVEASHMIKIGAVASAVMFAVRAFVQASMEAFLVSFGAGLLFMVYYVPLFSRLADAAEDEDVLEFYAFREFCLGLGKVAALAVAFFFALETSLATGLRVSFYFAAGAAALIALYADGLT
ncbi:MAG: hypothetical protein ABEJ91_03225 [Candidatus Nanohaloarchaea archaeon]